MKKIFIILKMFYLTSFILASLFLSLYALCFPYMFTYGHSNERVIFPMLGGISVILYILYQKIKKIEESTLEENSILKKRVEFIEKQLEFHNNKYIEDDENNSTSKRTYCPTCKSTLNGDIGVLCPYCKAPFNKEDKKGDIKDAN